jgi:hypothetical protein
LLKCSEVLNVIVRDSDDIQVFAPLQFEKLIRLKVQPTGNSDVYLIYVTGDYVGRIPRSIRYEFH